MINLRHAMACIAATVGIVWFTNAQALPRDQMQVYHFRKANPCPATGHTKGPCAGYNVDHKKPLMTGGADHPSNMSWIKTSEHKKKTKQDFADCKAGPVCLHRGLKKRDSTSD